MSNKKEIEIKFPLLNGANVVNRLKEIAKFKYEAHQIDEYFNAPHRDFTKKPRVCEWLRLRTSNGKYSINYKDYSPEIFCHEFESEISSKDHFNSLLKALNFELLVTVDKTRKVFDFDDVEISVDEVADLGSYIELEYKGNKENVDEARAYLFDVLSKINAEVGTQDKRGYPYELLIKMGKVSKN